MRQPVIVMHGLNTRYPGLLEAAEARGIAVLSMRVTHAAALSALDDLSDELSRQLRLVIKAEGEGTARDTGDH